MNSNKYSFNWESKRTIIYTRPSVIVITIVTVGAVASSSRLSQQNLWTAFQASSDARHTTRLRPHFQHHSHWDHYPRGGASNWSSLFCDSQERRRERFPAGPPVIEICKKNALHCNGIQTEQCRKLQLADLLFAKVLCTATHTIYSAPSGSHSDLFEGWLSSKDGGGYWEKYRGWQKVGRPRRSDHCSPIVHSADQTQVTRPVQQGWLCGRKLLVKMDKKCIKASLRATQIF